MLQSIGQDDVGVVEAAILLVEVVVLIVRVLVVPISILVSIAILLFVGSRLFVYVFVFRGFDSRSVIQLVVCFFLVNF